MQSAGHIEDRADAGALAVTFLAIVQEGVVLCKVARDSRPLRLALGMGLAHLEQSTASATAT